MPSQNIIVADNLKKVFKIYNTPSDRLKEAFSFTGKRYSHEHIALDGVSFTVKRGEFIGIVGKNGAGKSTLLKILSGSLTPTKGSAHINGTISLLQLGVGFNKELSGMENIKFSSKLLGHDKKTTNRIIEEAIDFADIGDFIDRPVKTYSSGMYSRLAFAIGITVKPDILIVDEVLSVGDMQFASKCLSRMHQLKESGMTALIVTHDVEKVAVFCDRAIWLRDAKIGAIGHARDIVEQFRDYMLANARPTQRNTKSANPTTPTSPLAPHDVFNQSIDWACITTSPSIDTGNVKITHAALYRCHPYSKANVFSRREKALLFIKLNAAADANECIVGLNIIDQKGLIATHTGSNFCENNIPHLDKNGSMICCFEFAIPPLKNGQYIFSLGIREIDYGTITFKANNILPFTIANEDLNAEQGGYVIIDEVDFHYKQATS